MQPAAVFGIGIYSPLEAARMIGMEASTLRRWLSGYRHGTTHEQPLWTSQYEPEAEGGVLLGFRDLVEARIVHALRGHGIGLQTIRTCMDRARAILGEERPFSTAGFRTDGRTIFLEITSGLDEPQLIDLKRRQGVFSRVVAPSLSDLDFGNDGAERWWLLGPRNSVVADPRHAFGQPVIAGHGVTTERIAQAVRAEGTSARVAQLFELKPRFVRDALRYEAHRTRQAA